MIISAVLLLSCADDSNDMTPGNPAMEFKTQFSGASFGDNLPFTVNVSDNVPLSTLTARLYFGDEQVSETVIRTKNDGDYTGELFVPYYKDIPDGTATLEFVLMDIHLTSIRKTFDLPVRRPQFPYLILVTANASYPMIPTGTANEYAATENFPSSDLPAYIKTPAVGANGNEITFGWDAGEITQGVVSDIPFVSPHGGVFSVTFNTKTYQAAPFYELFINGEQLVMLDKENFFIDMTLTSGQELTVTGIENIAEWWIDPDFFTPVSVGKVKFNPVAGKYRIIANTVNQYFRVEAMSGNAPATLQADGSGAIWLLGEGAGKPSLANAPGWNPGKGICLAPIGNKKYQVSFVAGQSINATSINFKFFHQNDWGGEFGGGTITTTSDVIQVGAGDGNLSLVAGVTLEEGAVYVLTIDVSGGNTNAILTVIKK
jgi:hypothetical protein